MPLFLNYSEILWKYICNYSSYCIHPPLYHNIAAPFKSEWSISPHLESELPLPLTLIKGAMVSQFWAWATGGLAVSLGSVGILLSPWEQLLDNPWRMSDMWPLSPSQQSAREEHTCRPEPGSEQQSLPADLQPPEQPKTVLVLVH